MRTWGRVVDANGNLTQWVQINTASDGSNDLVWAVTLIQNLKLNLNESPFYANYGLPAHQSIIQQIAPDFNVSLTQQRFSQYFANLVIVKVNVPTPTYNVTITTNQGVKITQQVPV